MPALDQAPEPSHGLMLLTPDSCPLPLSTLQDPDVCLHLPGSFLLLPWGSETQMPVEPGRQMAEADVMMREDQAKELLTMASEVIKGGGQHKHPRTWNVGKIMKNIQEKPSKLLSNLKERF